ncbi:hypothetical protein KKB44_03850 [Candidatus Micrarchaeota archaeon]|nr:hypothetical protein [Candidatus Micrarchaeota archaeon]
MPRKSSEANHITRPESMRDPRVAMKRFFASNATRSQLPTDLVKKLEEIKTTGNALLNNLRPYQYASVFYLKFSEDSHRNLKDTADNNSRGMQMLRNTAQYTREALRTAAEFVRGIFPSFRNEDLETTSALSAFFFLGAVARYGPDLIFESRASPEEKQALAEKFVKFYNEKIARYMRTDTQLKMKPETFHDTCYDVYVAFQKELPELFDALKTRLWTSGNLMAPYGSGRFSQSWTIQHYEGRL